MIPPSLPPSLSSLQEDAVVRVVDGVLEDVRLGLELNISKMNQRRFSGLKFLGELYSYQLVESNVVFRTLYLMLQFGATIDGVLNIYSVTFTSWSHCSIIFMYDGYFCGLSAIITYICVCIIKFCVPLSSSLYLNLV